MEDYSKSFLVTEFSTTEENVMIFCNRLTLELIEKQINFAKENYNEIIEIPSDQIQYYSFEPYYFSKKLEDGILKRFKN